MKSLRKQVEEKIKEIADILLNYDYQQVNSIGLLDGYAGIMLFLFQYSRYTGNQAFADQAVLLLYRSIEQINDGQANYSYSQGISGLGWVLHFLAQEDYIEEVDVLQPLDQRLCTCMHELMEEGDWDALHGGLGIAQYLWTRVNTPLVQASLAKTVESLRDQAIQDEMGTKWISAIHASKGTIYDFGLAHGIPSILMFLTRCIRHNIQAPLAKELLKEGTTYILSQRNPSIDSPNLYPIFIQEMKPFASRRLAWCYGDPGLLLAMRKANSILGTLSEPIKELVLTIGKRRDLQDNRMNDACVCHGTAGMIPILLLLMDDLHTRPYVSQELLEYWVKQTLEMGKIRQGLAGYQHVAVIEHQVNMSNVIGLLEGITGIGLCLLSFLNQDVRWTKCLIMN